MYYIAQEKLRENIRENMSGVYTIGIWSDWNVYPKPNYVMQTWMACDPDRAEELNKATFATLDSLRNGQFDEKYLNNAKITFSKSLEENMKSNRDWIAGMSNNYLRGQPLDSFLGYLSIVEGLDKKAIVKSAKKYLSFDKSCLSVYLFPAEE